MKISYLLSIAVTTLLLSGCGSTTSTDTEDADGVEETEGVEEIESSTSTVVTLHNQGESCASCHSLGSSNEEIFDSGATVFTEIDAQSLDANKIAQNYSLRLELASSTGTEYYKLGSGTGNFNATFNAGITNYTAQVLDAQGVVVNSSATDSHDSSRFDCNSCHTAVGTGGAPGRIVSFVYTAPTVDTTTSSTATTTPTFTTDVEPILTSNCLGCHGSSGNFSITNNTPYTGTMQFVDTTTATNSPILTKGSGVNHGGGVQLSDSEYITIRDWISAGALDN